MSFVCLTAACTSDQDATDDTTVTSPSTTPDADNTGKNAETPGADVTNQSESEEDIRISAAIRKSVTDDNSLSVNAHNVKITTAGGVVTLRGPVKSEQEKSAIEAKAKQVAGVTKVDNLIEVERNP